MDYGADRVHDFANVLLFHLLFNIFRAHYHPGVSIVEELWMGGGWALAAEKSVEGQV